MAQLPQRGGGAEAGKIDGSGLEGRVSQAQRPQLRALPDGAEQRLRRLREYERQIQICQRGHGRQPAAVGEDIRNAALQRAQGGQGRQQPHSRQWHWGTHRAQGLKSLQRRQRQQLHGKIS